MKLAFSTNAFKKYPLEESIRAIANIGYEGVEILGDVPHAYPPIFGKEQSNQQEMLFWNTRYKFPTSMHLRSMPL